MILYKRYIDRDLYRDILIKCAVWHILIRYLIKDVYYESSIRDYKGFHGWDISLGSKPPI